MFAPLSKLKLKAKRRKLNLVELKLPCFKRNGLEMPTYHFSYFFLPFIYLFMILVLMMENIKRITEHFT